MSPECRSLGQYIGALIEWLGVTDARAWNRLRQVVDGHRARIMLDGEVVEVGFAPDGELLIDEPATGSIVAGEGATDTATVLGLLDGHLEVNDALLDGRLRVTGPAELVATMFMAIEILLDASSRGPGLQTVARAFRHDPCHDAAPRPAPAYLAHEASAWSPDYLSGSQQELLRRLDLLADVPGFLDAAAGRWDHARELNGGSRRRRE